MPYLPFEKWQQVLKESRQPIKFDKEKLKFHWEGVSEVYKDLEKIKKVCEKIKKQKIDKSDKENIIKEKIGKFNGMTFFVVNGDEVKAKMEMDFVEGGNDERYKFIPENEIWLDAFLDPSQYIFVAFHESVEREEMNENGTSYDDAHKMANKEERKKRLESIEDIIKEGTGHPTKTGHNNTSYKDSSAGNIKYDGYAASCDVSSKSCGKIVKEEMTTKILYILRGISGSGKSTKAKGLVDGDMSKVFSTDDYFMKSGKYTFNPRDIPAAHEWNRKRVEKALIDGIGPIVVDNTNTELWEAKPYVNLGQRYGYEVKFVESEAPWRFDADELAKRNIHGVPKASIEKMIKRYVPHDQYTLDNVLKSKAPWEK